MKPISKIHEKFSNYLKEPRVLTEPQEFLGPNYEAVLDFWSNYEDLINTETIEDLNVLINHLSMRNKKLEIENQLLNSQISGKIYDV